MNPFIFKKNSFNHLAYFIQILLLVVYLSLNIINVGQDGTALPLLAGFVFFAGYYFLLALLKYRLTIRKHFFVFLLFVLWLSYRIIVDLQDFEHLKQITIATTGGVLLFFLIGTFVRKALDNLICKVNTYYYKFFLILYFIICLIIFTSLKGRLTRLDIFLIDDVVGGYQRPGNFIIMLFMITSFAFLTITTRSVTKKTISHMIWLFIYSLGMVLSLVNSQMMGSNAATANILAIYLMTVVLSFLAFNKTIYKNYLNNQLALPFSKKSLKKMSLFSLVLIIVSIVFIFILISKMNIDLSKTRAFGFGSNESSSVNSRIEILKETGIAQMGYSPLFGNTNVAYLVTGNSGRTLHNFIPNVIAELGLIGLIIVCSLFAMVFIGLIKEIKNQKRNEQGFIKALQNYWLMFVFIFLFLYSNISVGKSWPVMWFFIGFSIHIFGSSKEKLRINETGI